ncbi:GNAT family N-acetyltransferase [Corynebacterium uterequi]|uniref:Acetyltransferase (GNAT) family protein n=1 Tax=Corynebacterium uterequi TaxID=1072256 RepID=A0A0G3HI21_9CORY|nr:GNAT family N-acetyltransferase [Corynebacterium uterequi]AKK10777.1 acetyltransferase (GNAT) family protein [Corynebacterium uterequi]
MSDVHDRLVRARLDSPLAAPLVTELSDFYAARYADYGGFDQPANTPPELELYPPLLFTPPYGELVLIVRDGRAIAGGAFMYLDPTTAEIKRVWTSSQHRRQGLSRRIMAALEEAIIERGYRNAYLSTGPRQPEAVALYRSLGYTPLFDTTVDPESIGALAFEKVLAPDNAGPRLRGPLDALRGARQRRALRRTHKFRPRPGRRLGD